MKQIKRIQVSDIRVQYREGSGGYDAEAIQKAASLIHRRTGEHPKNLRICKKSIDARRDISFVYSVYAEIPDTPSADLIEGVKIFSEPELDIKYGSEKLAHRPIVVGFGPAGIFASLILAENGYEVIELGTGFRAWESAGYEIAFPKKSSKE